MKQLIGGVFGSMAEGATMSSANYFVKTNSTKFETAIANIYGTAWTNLLNVYAYVSGVMH